MRSNCELYIKFRMQRLVCNVIYRISMWHSKRQEKLKQIFNKWADKTIETGTELFERRSNGEAN